jgi:sulfoxide reductase heme-binding subunit YedZ
MLRTGSAGLILLVASLACTPASRLLRWPRVVQVRRALGLYAFLHIALHLFAYAVWENGLDLELMWRDLGERRAMSVGLAAFLALIPLAMTSTQGWQRRLGKNWKTLHRLVYPAALLSVLHFFLLDRDFITEPAIYAVIVGVLLALRLPLMRWVLRRRAASQRPE